ncbi:hypothetical protein [Halobacillus sp. K22]
MMALQTKMGSLSPLLSKGLGLKDYDYLLHFLLELISRDQQLEVMVTV